MSNDVSFPFEEFVRSRSPHLFKLALLLTAQNQAEAEDLLQIALERAYRRRAWLSRDQSPEPYVRKVLVNASIDRRRWLRRRGEQPLEYAASALVADDQSGDVANRDLLLRSLAALPPRQRRAGAALLARPVRAGDRQHAGLQRGQCQEPGIPRAGQAARDVRVLGWQAS